MDDATNLETSTVIPPHTSAVVVRIGPSLFCLANDGSTGFIALQRPPPEWLFGKNASKGSIDIRTVSKLSRQRVFVHFHWSLSVSPLVLAHVSPAERWRGPAIIDECFILDWSGLWNAWRVLD